MIYFDQAASSHPKPSEVGEAMLHTLNNISANPGRSGHALARKASDIIVETRERAAYLFGCSNPNKALFFQNATTALNQAIKGLSWSQEDHIIATTFEHNSIRRPLESLKRVYGVQVTYIDWDEDEDAFLKRIREAINPNTKLLAMTHASNVTGSVMPAEHATSIAKEQGITTLIDASQTAGHQLLHMGDMAIDMLAFPGHKGLLGPQGTGMLLVEGDIELEPIHHGGTGRYSEARGQPSEWPEKLESGTLNTPGIAGLNAALKVYETKIHNNVSRETLLTQSLYKGLEQISGVVCYGANEYAERMPIVAFNIRDISSQEIAMILDSHYNIAVRAGLHCSPLAHNALNTTDKGVVRASLSMYNTENEIQLFLEAISEISESYRILSE